MLKTRLEKLERQKKILVRKAAERARAARTPEEKEFEAFLEELCADDDFMRDLQRQLLAVEQAFPVDLDRPATVNLGGRLVHYDTAQEALECWGKTAILTEEERAELYRQWNEVVQQAVMARWQARRGAESPKKGASEGRQG